MQKKFSDPATLRPRHLAGAVVAIALGTLWRHGVVNKRYAARWVNITLSVCAIALILLSLWTLFDLVKMRAARKKA